MQHGLRWVLKERVSGQPTPSIFSLQQYVYPDPLEGEVQVAVRYHTIAPGLRAKLAAETYTAMVQVGDPIPGMGVGVVETSEDARFSRGDIVFGDLGWASHAMLSANDLQRLDPGLFGDGLPISSALSVLGPPGLTAYFGLLDVGAASEGETVIVSSAAGGVGSVVGQIGHLKGCRMVGIVGSQRKCELLIGRLNFDAAVDYRKNEDLLGNLRKACPEGAQLYFDNVGGAITDAALDVLSRSGRVVLCGLTSEYNRVEPRGLRNLLPMISRRLSMRGFISLDYADRFDMARLELAAWIRQGLIRLEPTIIAGLEHSADAFAALFQPNDRIQTLIEV